LFKEDYDGAVKVTGGSFSHNPDKYVGANSYLYYDDEGEYADYPWHVY